MMKPFNPYALDSQQYVAYYQNQAGGLLLGYAGSTVMHGSGLGGICCGLFRMAMPLLKKGLNIAKPHLKAAARNIVCEVVSNVMTTATGDKNQGGSGMLVMSRRSAKRPQGLSASCTQRKTKQFEKTLQSLKRNLNSIDVHRAEKVLRTYSKHVAVA